MQKDAVFCYYPQPVIPYAQSAFESDIKIHLKDESSKFFLMEIISCGRKASGERFQYRKYASKVSIWRSSSLIYRDNTRYELEKMDMEGNGIYESYTHMANIFLTGGSEELQQNIWEILEQEPECNGGVTKLVQNDLAVRIFRQRAQKQQEVAEKIKAAHKISVAKMFFLTMEII